MCRAARLLPILLVSFLFFPGALGSARAAEDCTLKLVSEIDLLSDDAVVFNGAIGDKPYQMALAGARSFSFMSQPIAAENHLVMRDFTRSQMGFILRSSIMGQKITQYAVLPSLVLGSLNMKDFQMSLVPQWNEPTAAFLAGNFMTQFDIELDLAHKKMRLFLKDHCPGQVVYWTDQYTTVPFRFGTYNNAFIATELDGKKIEASFDTLSPTSTIARLLAEDSFNLKADAAVTAAPAGSFKRLALGGVGIGDPQFNLADIPVCKVALPSKSASLPASYSQPEDCGYAMMNIGTNVLKKLRIYFETKENKVYISAANATK